ncbi:hypothetical protein POTTS_198 [Klebsiella phage vB_KpnM_Potts1]|uniref:DUF7320 domain-containing protein n=1 Tax=Klebsiella phage vB_KpnM_Potts1 TaxID=2591366 RepID=A0A5B9NF13_9CAUD|nr:hypothetical protein POTTS_198 [Klebsiella phage vB_KpnM_Potts1]
MYSNKTFTLEEFAVVVPQFAQALINKVSESSPDAKLGVRQETPVSYLITIEARKKEYYLLELLTNEHVQSTSVYPF